MNDKKKIMNMLINKTTITDIRPSTGNDTRQRSLSIQLRARIRIEVIGNGVDSTTGNRIGFPNWIKNCGMDPR
jgi:hypothetical protein